jgi:hypothetical protein
MSAVRGVRPLFLTCFFVAALLGLYACCALAWEDEKARMEAVEKVKSFTDQELKQSLGKLLSGSRFRDDPLYEPCLSEIVRRGGKAWEAFLNARLEALNKKEFKVTEDSDSTEPGRYFNLELLTALRRVQKEPDPLVVMLDVKGPLEANPLSLPRLKVAIKNVDSQKADIGFRDGGDYRSGRQARWRIVSRNEKGTELPEKELSGIIVAGGMFRDGILNYEKSWKTELDVRSFVGTCQPGKYSLEVLYHNTREIADASDISGLIVARSKPIVLVVRPLVIEITSAERKQVAQWISALEANKRLKIVAGTYGEWAHKFVAPTTPEGRILGAGLKAVPVLVESLVDNSLSDNKRAWILTLLFSATGENDPREPTGALGSYDYQVAGWQIWGGSPGEEKSGGLGYSDEGSSWGGKIDRQAQDKLTETWSDWLKTVEVKQGPASDPQKPETGKKQLSK